MTRTEAIGGIVHTYQKYDPRHFPSPTQPPLDLVSPVFEHMLAYGDLRELTEEELARAVRLDPSQIAGLGPSLSALLAMLEERKRKILATYETDRVRTLAARGFREMAAGITPPKPLREKFEKAVRGEQIRDLERLWYQADHDRSKFARQLVRLVERLGEKYQVDELAAKYEFTGRKPLDVPQALAIKEELEKIDELLKQLAEAARTAQIGVIDVESLSEFADPGEIERLNAIHQQVQDMLREMARQQGIEHARGAFQLTPQAYRLFQGRLLERIFSQLQASRTGRHAGPILGEGAVELQQTKPYEFGDSVANMDISGSLLNTLLRVGDERPLRMRSDDMLVHRTRNSPKCATTVLMDMSGSMRYNGQYINVKRMALALEGLIRREYPGDCLRFIEMATFARPIAADDIALMLPRPVSIWDPVVRLKADMSREDISEAMLPQHFTNIQHALQLARRGLATQDTPNRQVILITDGLPTAHFDGSWLHMLYPPAESTEAATLREGKLCQREGITINIFLLPSWSQSREDIQFAYRLAESTRGRVFFTAGRDLDRYVVWDYLQRRREIVA